MVDHGGVPAPRQNQLTHGRPRRLPGLLLAAWLLATATLVLLGIAVEHHLRGGQPGMAGMGSMSDSLYRAGSAPDGPLLSSNLFTAWQLDAVADAVLLLLATG